MGCCVSREADDDGTAHPYPPTLDAQNGAPDSSRRNITASSPAQPASIASPRGSHASQSHSHSQSRPNAPLKPIDPHQRSTLPNTLGSPTTTSGSSRHRSHAVTPLTDSTTQQWTRARLDKERNDWWDTRITGQPEIWKGVRMMVEHLQRGEVAEAQTLLDATECTCPNGQLWKGVFDVHGEWYRVPEWIVIEPDGLVEDDEGIGTNGKQHMHEAGIDGALEKDDDVEEVDQSSKPYKVRCRLTNQAKDVIVETRRGEYVHSIIQKVKTKAGLNEESHLRVVYAGKFYNENQSLESNELWKYEGHVLIVMVLG